MTRDMHGARVERFGQPLVPRELDIPTPGAGQILRQDRGLRRLPSRPARCQWRLPLKPALPFTPGHQGIGIVTALGTGGTAMREGGRLGVPWRHSACGHCEFCLAAQEPVCGEARFGVVSGATACSPPG